MHVVFYFWMLEINIYWQAIDETVNLLGIRVGTSKNKNFLCSDFFLYVPIFGKQKWQGSTVLETWKKLTFQYIACSLGFKQWTIRVKMLVKFVLQARKSTFFQTQG